MSGKRSLARDPPRTATAPRAAYAQRPAGRRLGASVRCLSWSAVTQRYGDPFTLRIRHAGTWVFLCDPEDVKQVFTADAHLRRRR